MANETLEVFAVLANRFGAWSLRAELEDLAFETLQPEAYAEVAALVQARAAEGALEARVNELKQNLRATGLEVVDVSGRVKNVYGVWKKLNAGASVDSVMDVLALRVVVPHKHDCYKALREVEQLWSTVPGRFKDYIRNRKLNGYQSIHTTVVGSDGRPFEVQIRTPKMHYIAEFGFAAHWRYKERLGRVDLWLDRLVQWKKWVATEKFGIADGKVRPSGSPARDMSLATLGLGQLEHVVADSKAKVAAAAVAAGHAAAVTAAAAGQVAAATAALVSDTASAMADTHLTPSALLDPFLLNDRFRLQPVSDDDLHAQPVSVLISAPRGVRVAELPAGCTVSQLMLSGVITDQEARGCDIKVNGSIVRESSTVKLQAGDQVQLVQAQPVYLPGLDIYMPGRTAPYEAVLEKNLRMSTIQLRTPATVS